MAQTANIATIINTNKRQKIVPLHVISFKTELYMFIIESIKTFGSYLMMMKRVLTKPERWGMFLRRTLHEIYQLGINSIPIVLIISIFIGAVMCIQMKTNVESPWMPKFVTGYATREIMLLEFSSSIMCLILAGKVGSNITSEIGTMRITEQIDALEIMGVNSASYLILPKIVATVIFFPILTLFSIIVGILGGFAIAYLTGIMLTGDYIEGLFYCFEPFSFTYALVKGAVFAFIITSISAYCGYYAKGNSLEVGRASTKAVVASSVTIMIFDLILTQIMRV